MNNLPVGLIAGSVVAADQVPAQVVRRDADRRRPRAEPVGDRLARDDPVARRAPAGRDRGRHMDFFFGSAPSSCRRPWCSPSSP